MAVPVPCRRRWHRRGSKASTSLGKAPHCYVAQAQLALIGAQMVLHEVGSCRRNTCVRQWESAQGWRTSWSPKPAPPPLGSHRVHCTGLGLGLTARLCSQARRGSSLAPSPTLLVAWDLGRRQSRRCTADPPTPQPEQGSSCCSTSWARAEEKQAEPTPGLGDHGLEALSCCFRVGQVGAHLIDVVVF